jgi:hypothetical protein
MSKFTAKLIGDGFMSVVYDNTPYTVDNGHVNWSKLRETVKNDDPDEFVRLYDVKKSIETYCGNDTGITIEDGVVMYNGVAVHNVVSDLILRNMREGFDVAALVNFLTKLYKNSSYNSREHLFNFLTKHRLTITEDGNFLAYKCVRDNYMDKHSGKFSNHVGAEISMPRQDVDDNPNNECSYGFHVGGLAYSGPGGAFHNSNDKVLIVSVDPSDVVAVPKDYDFLQMRTCKYVVVGEYKGELKGSVYSGKVGDDYEENDYEDDYEDEVLEPEDMLVGRSYTFMYYKEEEGHSQRYAIVLEKYNNRIVAELVEPEEYAGQVRSFKFENMDDVETYDV